VVPLCLCCPNQVLDGKIRILMSECFAKISFLLSVFQLEAFFVFTRIFRIFTIIK